MGIDRRRGGDVVESCRERREARWPVVACRGHDEAPPGHRDVYQPRQEPVLRPRDGEVDHARAFLDGQVHPFGQGQRPALRLHRSRRIRVAGLDGQQLRSGGDSAAPAVVGGLCRDDPRQQRAVKVRREGLSRHVHGLENPALDAGVVRVESGVD